MKQLLTITSAFALLLSAAGSLTAERASRVAAAPATGNTVAVRAVSVTVRAARVAKIGLPGPRGRRDASRPRSARGYTCRQFYVRPRGS